MEKNKTAIEILQSSIDSQNSLSEAEKLKKAMDPLKELTRNPLKEQMDKIKELTRNPLKEQMDKIKELTRNPLKELTDPLKELNLINRIKELNPNFKHPLDNGFELPHDMRIMREQIQDLRSAIESLLQNSSNYHFMSEEEFENKLNEIIDIVIKALNF